jgi:hypothetical protein
MMNAEDSPELQALSIALDVLTPQSGDDLSYIIWQVG